MAIFEQPLSEFGHRLGRGIPRHVACHRAPHSCKSDRPWAAPLWP